MSYCTRDDLAARFGANEVADLLDRDNTGADDPMVFDAAASDAAALIDAVIGVRYSVPLTAVPVPQIIVAVACDITRYNLWDDKAPEHVTKRREAALKTLGDIAAGVFPLPAGVGLSEAFSSGGIEYEANERTFTTDTLADY